MKRRHLLQAGLALSVGFALPGCALPVIPKRPRASDEAALGWVRHEGGRYTLLLPRVEMGQHIATALKQVACDELGVGWDDVTVRLPHTGELPRVRATVGSESVKDFALPLAQACATLRDALARGQATGRLSAEPRPIAELRAFAPGARFVGKDMPLVDGHAIVTGAPLFVADQRPAGLLHARVLRAPASPELRSSVAAFDASAAQAVPGFVAVLRDQRLAQNHAEGLAIVARTPGALDRIEAALNVRWAVEGSASTAAIDQAIDIDRRIDAGDLAHGVMDEGQPGSGPWDVDLRIDIPLAAHAPIEPRAAVASIDASGVMDLWVGSQDVFYQRDVVSRRLGLDESRLRVHGTRVGGAFGGKTICTVELEAAVLCQLLQRPVKVQWTRAQEFRQGFHRPPSSHRIRARLQGGRLDAWSHAFSSSHILFTAAVVPAWLQRLTDVIGDDGVARGSALPYRAPHRQTRFALTRLPVLTGPWRGLGAGPNGLAIESAIDECARTAGDDPVAFRLRHIAEPRLARTLQAAADAAPPAPTGLRTGRGVACGTYKQHSHAAVVADVRVDRDGTVHVTHLTCAHDCGRVIHPDQVRAQCEGNLVWGIGMVLTDGLVVADGQVSATGFAEAPIPRMAQVPPMRVVLVDSAEASGGAGETAIVAAAAAIANAVCAATGVRPTRFPLQSRDFAQT